MYANRVGEVHVPWPVKKDPVRRWHQHLPGLVFGSPKNPGTTKPRNVVVGLMRVGRADENHSNVSAWVPLQNNPKVTSDVLYFRIQ
jgi:hypothetical protein